MGHAVPIDQPVTAALSAQSVEVDLLEQIRGGNVIFGVSSSPTTVRITIPYIACCQLSLVLL